MEKIVTFFILLTFKLFAQLFIYLVYKFLIKILAFNCIIATIIYYKRLNLNFSILRSKLTKSIFYFLNKGTGLMLSLALFISLTILWMVGMIDHVLKFGDEALVGFIGIFVTIFGFRMVIKELRISVFNSRSEFLDRIRTYTIKIKENIIAFHNIIQAEGLMGQNEQPSINYLNQRSNLVREFTFFKFLTEENLEGHGNIDNRSKEINLYVIDDLINEIPFTLAEELEPLFQSVREVRRKAGGCFF